MQDVFFSPDGSDILFWSKLRLSKSTLKKIKHTAGLNAKN